MPNLEDAIRERAYHLWLADGRPEGQADIYWLTAQREILASAVETSDQPEILTNSVEISDRETTSDREAMASLTEMIATRLGKKRRPDRGYAWRRVG